MKRKRWKHNLYAIIFESESKAGKAFDIAPLFKSITSNYNKFGPIFVIFLLTL